MFTSCFIYFAPILTVWKHLNWRRSHSLIIPLSSPVTTIVLFPMLSTLMTIDRWPTSLPTTTISWVKSSYCQTFTVLLNPSCKILSVPGFTCREWQPEYYISAREAMRDLSRSSLWIWSYLRPFFKQTDIIIDLIFPTSATQHIYLASLIYTL